jgi:hypothetical protein
MAVYNSTEKKMKFLQFFEEKPGKKVKVDDVRKILGIENDELTKGGRGFRAFMNEHITVRNPLPANRMGSSSGEPVLLGYTKRTTNDTIEDEIEDNFDPSLSINPSDSVSQVCSNAQSPRQQRYQPTFQPTLSILRSNCSRKPQSTANLQEEPLLTFEEIVAKSLQTQSQLEQKNQTIEFEKIKELFTCQKQELSTAKQEIDHLRKKQDTKKTEHRLGIEALKYTNKQDADSLKLEYKQEIELLRTQHSKEKQNVKDEFRRLKQELTDRCDDLKRQNEELADYRSLTVTATIARKLQDNKLLGLSTGIEVAPNPKIFIKRKQTAEGRNKFFDNL